MNILLTSVGRRAYMVKYFKDAVGENGEVHIVNSTDMTPAFKYADKATVCPLIYDKKYISFLLDYCQNNRIDIIVSLFDIDLLVLSQNKQQFEDIGTRVIVSDEEIIAICNDKWKTYNFLHSIGLNTPKTYLTLEDTKAAIEKGEISYPVFVKPRFGCGSISVNIAYNLDDLCYLTKKAERKITDTYLKYESDSALDKIIYQEMLCGKEYGADIINDLIGSTKAINIREKIAMRAGETDIAKTVENKPIFNALSVLGLATHHIANMDVDVFLVDGTPYILEMNCRFGGGYPFCHLSGCNLPLAICRWVGGGEVTDDMLVSKTGIIGFKELIITDK